MQDRLHNSELEQQIIQTPQFIPTFHERYHENYITILATFTIHIPFLPLVLLPSLLLITLNP